MTTLLIIAGGAALAFITIIWPCCVAAGRADANADREIEMLRSAK